MQLRYLENFSSLDLAGNSFPQERAWGAVLDPRGFRAERLGEARGLAADSAAQSFRREDPGLAGPSGFHCRRGPGEAVSQWRAWPCSAGVPPYPCFQSVPGSCEGPNPRWAELQDGSELPTSGGIRPHAALSPSGGETSNTIEFYSWN